MEEIPSSLVGSRMPSNPQLRDSALFCQYYPPGHLYNSSSCLKDNRRIVRIMI